MNTYEFNIGDTKYLTNGEITFRISGLIVVKGAGLVIGNLIIPFNQRYRYQTIAKVENNKILIFARHQAINLNVESSIIEVKAAELFKMKVKKGSDTFKVLTVHEENGINVDGEDLSITIEAPEDQILNINGEWNTINIDSLKRMTALSIKGGGNTKIQDTTAERLSIEQTFGTLNIKRSRVEGCNLRLSNMTSKLQFNIEESSFTDSENTIVFENTKSSCNIFSSDQKCIFRFGEEEFFPKQIFKTTLENTFQNYKGDGSPDNS